MSTLKTPDVPKAMRLVELAYMGANPTALVPLGWADSSVMESPAPINFTVEATTDDQEGSVLIVAVRVPHPDFIDLAGFTGGAPCPPLWAYVAALVPGDTVDDAGTLRYVEEVEAAPLHGAAAVTFADGHRDVYRSGARVLIRGFARGCGRPACPTCPAPT